MQDNKTTISLCMITLNESKFISTALDNVREYVDEIIVVDGGSIDNTVKIAEKFGAKIFFHKWNNDFSEQRNNAINHATKEWILFIDADEVYEEQLLDKLKLWINNNIGIDMFAFPRKNYIDGIQTSAYPDKQLRLFKNNKIIKYVNKVHEMPTGFVMAAFPTDLHIVHKKTSSRQDKQNKYYEEIIQK